MSIAQSSGVCPAAVKGLRDEDGFAELRDYAAIGDGRTVALVARDGSIDWLPLPDLDSPSIFAALLDPQRGGRFALHPVEPFEVERRYLPATNVLETTFHTSRGTACVVDALTLTSEGLAPLREIVRVVRGVRGHVRFRWSFEPRFGYGERPPPAFEWRGPFVVAQDRGLALALCTWDAGTPTIVGHSVRGEFETGPAIGATLALVCASEEPLLFPSLADVERRLGRTTRFWQEWSAALTYEGPFRDAVSRSALALKLLVFSPSGAIAAAATTSLPEHVGGERNWDYRFCWLRDSSFTLRALLALGCRAEAQAFFWWFMHATALTRPRLGVLYRLDGGAHTPERTLRLDGYRHSRPVRVGNAAAVQSQLDVYGDLFRTADQYATAAGSLDWITRHGLEAVADHVCRLWRQPDSGIWEVRSAPRHFTHSKAMCWAALDVAAKLADRGLLSAARRARWRSEANAILGFIERECWSDAIGSYVRAAGSQELDASLLVLPFTDFPNQARTRRTVDAIERNLGHGPFVHRYFGEDGLRGREGAFLVCSFWLVEALARTGQTARARTLMEQLMPFGNDVGLFAEEIDVASGAFLGNFPQGLVHLAIISAAVAMTGRGGS